MKNALIERRILDIARVLSRNGFQAFLVGGCVRDILLNRKPKDFDIATDAHPRQIKRLFPRCYLIGRRFRLAHVYISSDRFIEVATFRATIDPEEAQEQGLNANNVFGTFEEDALRRDFTINALYYDPSDESIIDHTGGLVDIRSRMIRSIGNPDIRFQEDPVRMIRAARFCAQLNFRLSRNDYRYTLKHAGLIAHANANRLLDELLKILRCGASAETISYLRRFNILPHWLPELTDRSIHPAMLKRLAAVDRRRLQGSEFSTSVHISVLLYDLFEPVLKEAGSRGNVQDIFIALRDSFQPMAQRMRLSRNDWNNICNIVARQIIFYRPVDKKKSRSEGKFLTNHHFADSLVLFTILCEAQDSHYDELTYWTSKADSVPKTEEKTHQTQRQLHREKTRVREVKNVQKAEKTEDAEAGSMKKKRKRRRRRKPQKDGNTPQNP